MEMETPPQSTPDPTLETYGDGDRLHLQFLHFASCPNASRALTLLRDVLRAEVDAYEIEMITVETDEAARQYDFYGSPTIRVNGDDVSPPDAAAEPSLACRIYRQPDGRLAPYPPAEAIAQALHRARR
jgi:hypothetical protein